MNLDFQWKYIVLTSEVFIQFTTLLHDKKKTYYKTRNFHTIYKDIYDQYP